MSEEQKQQQQQQQQPPSEEDEDAVDNDYYPMWTKVYSSKQSRYCYFNNFDGSFEWIKPDDYNAETDDNYIKKEHLTLSEMPTYMKRLAASIKIQKVLARGNSGRKRIQCLRGDNKFNSMSEKERTSIREHLHGWIEMNDFTQKWETVQGTYKKKEPNTKYWYHPGTVSIVKIKPDGHDAGKNLLTNIAKIEDKHAARVARRKAHKELMAKGFEEVKQKVNAQIARHEFKQKQREKRAAEHEANLKKKHQELHMKHQEDMIKKKEDQKKQAIISAKRAVEHQNKMKEAENKMKEEQTEHEKLIFNLERRASVILESGSGPWKLHVGIERANDLRAADWALRGGGKSDPYAKVFLNGREVGKTQTIKKTLNPVWNCDIDLDIENIEELGANSWNESKLTFCIYDYDVVGSDDLLGEVNFIGPDLLNLLHLNTDDDGKFGEAQINRAKNEVQNSFVEYEEHKLCNPEGIDENKIKKSEQAKGSIVIAADLRVVLKKRQVLSAKKDRKTKEKLKKLRKQHEDSMNDLSKQEESKAELYETMGAEIAEVMLPLDQSSISEWILETSFISAKGLKKADRFGKSDPYVTVYVNGISVGSSKTIKKTLQPEWNQTKQLLVHRKKHFQKANKTRWQDSEVIFEVYDHDLVGTDDPLGRIVLNGEELLAFLTSEERGKGNEEEKDRELFERNGKRSKGTLRVKASLKPAGTDAIAAAKAEHDRLAAIEASKVTAPWTVWIRMHDNVAHAEYWVHSQSGLTTFELPVPAGSTKETEATKMARVLPEDLEKGPPKPYKEHMAALLISKMARRRAARTKVLIKRAQYIATKNGCGINQLWVEAFHPYGSRIYFWNSETNEIEWDTAPEEMKKIQREWIRSFDSEQRKYYYHSPPFDKDSWQWNVPATFIIGGHAKTIDAATSIQSTYRSFFSRMANTSKKMRKNIFSFASLENLMSKKESSKMRKKLRTTMQKNRMNMKKVSKSSKSPRSGEEGEPIDTLTSDERAEIILNKGVKRLQDIIESFELPYRHRCSRRSDRRKVLNKTQLVIVDAVEMSIGAGYRIAAAKGFNTPALGKPKTEGKLSRTTQEIMIDEVNAFAKKVKNAADAAEGSAAMIAWYEVESVYRLKRLLAGLTAMDIYHLSAPEHEDVGAEHEQLKISIKKAESCVRAMLAKLGKGFRKALRRWDKMMKEDCGRALVSVSTQDLLPVDRTLETSHIRADEGGRGLADPLRYGKYYWITVNKSRMMPFPVDMGGISFKRMKKYILNMSKPIYNSLEHAKRYLMLVGDERDKRIGREELLRMRRAEAYIRTAMYMAKLRAEKRAKQEVFNAMCRSQWSSGKKQRMIEEKEERLKNEKTEEMKRDEIERKSEELAERIQTNLRLMTSPWEVIKHKAPIDVIHDKLTEEHRRWAFQEKKKFDVNSRDLITGESLVGNAVIFNHEEALQYLIDMGADVNQIDSLIIRSTPLIQAAKRGDRWVGVARILIQNGAKISAQDIRGDTALHIASRNGAEKMVRFLLSCRNGNRLPNNDSKQYYPRDISENSENPVGENIEEYGQEFIRMISIPNNKSQTALDLATSTSVYESIKFFYEMCSNNADMNEDDLKYLKVRKRKILLKEQQRLAEDLSQNGSGGVFGGGLVLAPLLGPMSSRPASSDVPDSVKLRRRLEQAKQKHKMRRLKGLPGASH